MLKCKSIAYGFHSNVRRVFLIITHNWTTASPPFRVLDSSVIGIPSPHSLRADQFPGIRIGDDPIIGSYCVLFSNVFIGNNFRCGNRVFIRDGTSIGDNVSLGDMCFIDTGVSIGNGVTIRENVRVPSSTTIGDKVCVGPNVTFTSEPSYPGCRRNKSSGVIFEDGCVIGANVVMGAGVCVGAGARIAPGTTVTHTVPPNVHASGSPMRFQMIAD